MPKKNMTPEERKAFGEKMKAARAAKQVEKIEQVTDIGLQEQPTLPDVPIGVDPITTISQDDLNSMLSYIKELESANWRKSNQQTEGLQLNSGGGLVGTVEKFSTEATSYPDPVERLKTEDRLKRFAFVDNYDLDFNIKTISYTTIDGIRTKEPKFELNLIRKMYDDMGELTNGRYTVCRLIMHEDPDTAIQIAQDNGIVVESEDEKTFLDEMRYLRCRDWLLECFYPAPVKREENKREMVIDGKLVEYFEVKNEEGTTTQGSGIDWSKAPKIAF